MIRQKQKAFTIVELLTVISIIALIIGLLVPGLNRVRIISREMKQKAQFHAIVTGLEMFNTENERYPDSSESDLAGGGQIITGAHKMTEALVGRDMQGYDPVSNIDNPTDYTNSPYGYRGNNNVDDIELDKSLDRREGPYLGTDNLVALNAEDIYTGPLPVYDGNSVGMPAPLLTDIFNAKRVNIGNSSVSAGTPILYYKADVSKNFNDWSDPADSVYNIYDNDELVKLGTVKDQDKQHKLDSDYNDPDPKIGRGINIFYNMIRNPSATPSSLPVGQSRPYKSDSYILISAGYDGVFGTDDDITNFKE